MARFCNLDNCGSCLFALNQALHSFGYPNIHLSCKTEEDVVILNVIYTLVQKHQVHLIPIGLHLMVNFQDHLRFQEELMLKERRLQSDKEHLQLNLTRIEEKLVQREREITFLQEKIDMGVKKFSEMKEKLENEKEQLHKKVAALQHKDMQYKVG